MALAARTPRPAGVVDVRSGPPEQISVEHEDAHRGSLAAGSLWPTSAPVGRSGRVFRVSTSQRYRLRNPATGREIVIEAEPTRSTWTATAASSSKWSASCCRSPPPPRGCRGRWRTFASARGATSSPRRISTTAPPAAGGWGRWDRPAQSVERSCRRSRARAAARGSDLGGVRRRRQHLGRRAQEHARHHPADDTSAEKAAAQTTSTATSTSKTSTGESSCQRIGRQRSHRRTG